MNEQQQTPQDPRFHASNLAEQGQAPAEGEPRETSAEGGASSKAAATNKVTLFGGSRFGRWFDNFWYHYKVQTLIALFLLVAITVCVVQCAARPKKPDVSICYAGYADLRPTTSNSVARDMETALTTMAQTALDKDSARAEMVHYLIRPDATDAAAKSLTQTNLSNLRTELDVANSYIFLMDEALYNSYTVTEKGAHYMAEVQAYLPENSAGLEITADGRGVYLRSTPLSLLPGFSELPQDTVLCLRVGFSVSGTNSKTYPRAEALFRLLLTPGQ